VNEITTAIKVYAYGVEDFVNDPSNANLSLNTQLSCEGIGDSRWKTGDRFFRYVLVGVVYRFTHRSQKKLNSVAFVRKRTIPTERPPLVGEVSANFSG
jgi:hypothetical protein